MSGAITRPTRGRLAAIVLVLLLAAALRTVNLGGHTLWYDETFAVLFAEAGPEAMLEGTLAQGDGDSAAEEHPPLYYFALAPWIAVSGRAALPVRMLSALAGLLTVAVLYRLAADLFGRGAGLAAAFMAACAPFHVQYSQEARMYALMALWLTLATWCFVRALGKNSRRWWAAFAVFAALSMYTQQLSAFYLLAIALYPVVLRRWDVVRRVAMAGAGALLLYLPWLLQLPSQLGKLENFWLERPGAAQIVQTLFGLAVPLIDLPSGVYIGGLMASLLLIALLALHARRAWKRVGESLGLALWLAVAPVVLMFAAGQVAPVYLLRALLPSALMFYAAAGWLLAHGRVPRFVAGAAIGLWLAVGGIGLGYHYTRDTFPNAPFDAAAATLEETLLPGEVIVHSNKLSFLPMVYYAPSLPQVFVADPAGAQQDTLASATQEVLGVAGQRRECVQVAVQGTERVYFVVFARELDESGDARERVRWLGDHFDEVEYMMLSDLYLLRFTGPDETVSSAECAP
jgi:4-amino-4-deoxy-L-arabinose transferase-like glycosyltransferase